MEDGEVLCRLLGSKNSELEFAVLWGGLWEFDGEEALDTATLFFWKKIGDGEVRDVCIDLEIVHFDVCADRF